MRFFYLSAIVLFLAGCNLPTTTNIESSSDAGKDFQNIARENKWKLFNGEMELGIPGKAVPGYSLRAFFVPSVMTRHPEKNYFPVTAENDKGNKYLKVPGYYGLREYNVASNKFFMDRDGSAELSFRAKITPGEDGKFHAARKLIMDFRCQDLKRLYGTVKERYPVLVGKSFKPGKNWKLFKFKVPVKGGFKYQLTFRHYTGKKGKILNGLCIDDISINYNDSENLKPIETVLIPDREMPAYKHGDSVKFNVQALLNRKPENLEMEILIRKDYFNTVCSKLAVKLKPTGKILKDGRNLYTGSCSFDADTYGSFNALAFIDGSPLFSKGGDFICLHELPEKVSPLQRKIGGHFRTHGSRYQLVAVNEWTSMIRHGLGLDSEAALYSMSGLKHIMYSFDLKKVQPAPEKMDFVLPDTEIAVLEKNGIETIGCLGGWWIYADYKRKAEGVEIRNLPYWFYDDKYTIPTGVKKDARSVKDKYWRFHVNEVVNRFGSKIKKWMVQVEPQWVLSPKEYFSLQKTAYKIVKKDNHKALFIAGDATSDQGYNLTNWMKNLRDLGFEKYLDCASFNPYGSSSDYIDGVLFRYSNLIKRLKKILDPQTALWQEELYYIANSKRKQNKAQQYIFSAGDAQRQYLLGLLNGLRGVTGITGISLFKYSMVPSDVSAGLNAMSSFLAGKDKCVSGLHPNRLLRCGIFTGKPGDDCTGVIWSLRPKGAFIKTGAVSSIDFYDCFGNPIEVEDKLALGLDPVFVRGDFKTLRKFFTKSRVAMGVPVKIRQRKYGNKVFLEAQNKSGGQGIAHVIFTDNVPAMRFVFDNSDFSSFSFDKPLDNLKFKASLQEVEQFENSKIITLPEVKEYSLKPGAGNRLGLKLNNSAVLKAGIEKGMLVINAKVKDSELTAAENNHLYSADALEVFIDRTPFSRLGTDEHNRKMTAGLALKQYVFSPLKSKTGKDVLLLDSTTGSTLETEASVKATKTSGGYKAIISIPLKEILPLDNSAGIIGMNFELCRKDGNKKLPKAYLTSPRRPCYKYRLHYPLFKIHKLKNTDIKNSGFESGKKEWKSPGGERLKKEFINIVSDSFSGRKALKVSLLEEPSWGPTLLRGNVSSKVGYLKPGKYTLRFYAKGAKLDHMKVSLGRQGPVILRHGNLPAEKCWTKYEIPFDLPSEQNNGRIYMEFFSNRRDRDAYAVLDGFEIIKN